MSGNNFMGIIGTLSGVVLGGLITFLITYFQFKNQEKQNKEKRKLEIYEQIHKHLTFIEHEAGDTLLQIVVLIKQGTPLDETERDKLPWQELEMLTHFYTAELREDIKFIRKKVGELGEMLANAVYERYDKYNGHQEMKVQAEKVNGQIEKQVDIAKNKLIALVKKIV